MREHCHLQKTTMLSTKLHASGCIAVLPQGKGRYVHHHSSVALAAEQAAAQSSSAAAAASTAGAKAFQAAPQAPLQPGRQPRGALGQGVRDGRKRAEGRRSRSDIVVARPAGCTECQSCHSRHAAHELLAG